MNSISTDLKIISIRQECKFTFWYLSPAPVCVGASASTSPAPSPPKDSLATSANGLEPAFLAVAFFAFGLLGGVVDITESRKSSMSSRSDASFSEPAFAFFFVAFAAGFAFRVVCVNFLALVAAGFALAFGF